MESFKPLDVHYSRPFYVGMLAVGLVCCVIAVDYATAIHTATTPQDSAAGSPAVIWLIAGAVILCMAYYMVRALRRLGNARTPITIRADGIVLLIGGPQRFGWNDVVAVKMGRFHMRDRLELTVTRQRFETLALPGLLSDDNFMAVRQKPFTIGITGQGLDRRPGEIFDAIRRCRPELVQP